MQSINEPRNIEKRMVTIYMIQIPTHEGNPLVVVDGHIFGHKMVPSNHMCNTNQ